MYGKIHFNDVLKTENCVRNNERKQEKQGDIWEKILK